MGEEIELASRAAGEVTGQVADVLVDKAGVLEPPHAIFRVVATALDAFFYPPLITLCQRAAAKMEARGLSRCAIETLPPRLLRGILEDGALEQDESMQERWANLPASAMTESSAQVRTAFPTMLGELEPSEAALLDALADAPPTTEAFCNEYDSNESAPDWVRLLTLSFQDVRDLKVEHLNSL